MIKILILNSDNSGGVGYHRIVNPHININEKDIYTEIRLLNDGTLPLMNPNYIKQYNIIFFNKVIPFANNQIEDNFFNICKQNNIKLVYDIDDYWKLDSTHLNYKNWKKNNSDKKIENILSKVDVITTTTQIFADEISKINNNVIILPNALNMNEMQWNNEKYKSDKIRFIWGGGISHMVDIILLKKEFKKFDKNFINKSQLYLCGYDLRTRINDNMTLKDDYRKSFWGKFEGIFTNNNRYIKDYKYQEYLINSSNFDNDETYGKNEEFITEFYQRRHTKPILLYGTMYKEADIALAPLKNKHSFNKYKSQLKVIESGVHKMPLIASDYYPYQIDDIEGKIDGKQKGFLIDEKISNWYEKMKWYVDNPSAIEDHGNNNYEHFLKNYEMNVVNKKRIELYRDLSKQEPGNINIENLK